MSEVLISEVPVPPAVSSPPAKAVPSLLVELDPWPRVFLDNLRGLLSREQPSLPLASPPGTFWSDVFVQRRLPWLRIFESLGYHALAVAALVSFSRFWPQQSALSPRASFDHVEVVNYEPVATLPPLDTRRSHAARPQKADPELSRQPIISLPPEADNRYQTIVAPPTVKLKRDSALPNIVSWSDQSPAQRPELAVAPRPVVLASSITRIAPKVANSVVAPPPDLRATLQNKIPRAPQAAIIEPPPEVANSSIRTAGQINIGHSAVIAPAPQLAVGEQRAFPRAASSSVVGGARQVVPPPPSGAASGYSTAGRRVIALNLHPAVGAPSDPPAGNRRGAFAATPDGHRGASGAPGISGNATGHGNDTKESGNSNLPAGLYVGKATLPSPGASIPAHSDQAERARLSEPERAVFGDRRFYSLTLNMPNLNSAGGSWVIHFAEINQDSAASGLSAPTAIRKVDPAYPLQLMRENVAGTVIVYAVIHADGSVGAVRVLRGIDDRIDPFASQAISHWQFHPATKNGAPVDVEATFLIPFRPPRPGSSF